MTDTSQSDSSDRGDQPGKTRTWWHPLFARLLDFVLGSAFTVSEEVLVGKMPLRVDILLARREEGQLSEARQRELSALIPLLNQVTLIEFKGPTDVLERGDLAQLVGCSYLWHSQQDEQPPHTGVSLIVLAPTINGALREELRLLGFEASQHEPGVFRVSGLPFTIWLVETDVMAQRGQPLLSLVSRVFLNDCPRIMKEMTRTGHEVLLHYMVQQIQQFRALGEDFAMQHKYSENLKELEEELLTQVLEAVPAERRLRGLAADERLRGLPPEERLRGLTLEERLAGLSDEDAARLRELLERKREH